MGNGNSILEESFKQYENLGEFSQPAYGDFRLLKNRQNYHQLAQKKVISDNSSEVVNIHGIANRYERTRNPYVVKGKSFLKNSESLCSQFYKLTMYFEYYEQNLATLKSIEKSYFNNLNESGSHLNDSFEILFSKDFSEEDYLHVIYCSSGALEFIHEDQRYHGSVNPWTILVSPDNYKLADHMLLNGVNGFTEIMTNPKSKVYLAPELFECLKRGAIEENISMQKADIFSLGFTILSLLRGVKPDTFYNFSIFSFNSELLESHLHALSYSYSKEFIYLLSSMLDLNPKRRFSAQEITDYMNKTYGNDNWGKMAFSKIDRINGNFPIADDIKESFQRELPSRINTEPKESFPILNNEPPNNMRNNFHDHDDSQKKLRLYYYPPEPINPKRQDYQQPSYESIPYSSFHNSLQMNLQREFPHQRENYGFKPPQIPRPAPQIQLDTSNPYKRKSHINDLRSEIDQLDDKLNSLMNRTSRENSRTNNFKYF